MNPDPDLGCAKHDGYIIGCVECLRVWLDRSPPPKPPDERDWEEFELSRVTTRVWPQQPTADSGSVAVDAAPEAPVSETTPDAEWAAHAAHA